MWSNMLNRRSLLIAVMLPLAWIASMPLAYCVCPTGRTVIVSAGKCVGCDCSCCDDHSYCRASKPVTPDGDVTNVCSKGCRRSVIEPSFTSAANFEWNQTQAHVWIEWLPSRLVASIDVRVVATARHTILPHSDLYLEHGVLLL